MKYDYSRTNIHNDLLKVAETDGMFLDYDDITDGIKASKEDFKHGRYMDAKTSMDLTRNMLFGK